MNLETVSAFFLFFFYHFFCPVGTNWPLNPFLTALYASPTAIWGDTKLSASLVIPFTHCLQCSCGGWSKVLHTRPHKELTSTLQLEQASDSLSAAYVTHFTMQEQMHLS